MNRISLFFLFLLCSLTAQAQIVPKETEKTDPTLIENDSILSDTILLPEIIISKQKLSLEDKKQKQCQQIKGCFLLFFHKSLHRRGASCPRPGGKICRVLMLPALRSAAPSTRRCARNPDAPGGIGPGCVSRRRYRSGAARSFARTGRPAGFGGR